MIKKTFLLSLIILLILAGCQYIPILLPTPTKSNQVLTITPEEEGTPTPVETLTVNANPSQTPIFTQTLTPLPTVTPTPFPLILQPGSPAYIQNFSHIDADCKWLGIAGQIFDANDKPISNLVINIKGKLGQTEIDKIGLTGVPEADIYGPGGYEIVLADNAVNSDNTLRIQIFDIHGNSMTNAIPFKTFSDCEKNLIIINFLMK